MKKICNQNCTNEIKEDFEEQEHKAKKEKRINQVREGKKGNFLWKRKNTRNNILEKSENIRMSP